MVSIEIITMFKTKKEPYNDDNVNISIMWSWFSRLTTKKRTNQVDVRKEDENIRKEEKKKD